MRKVYESPCVLPADEMLGLALLPDRRKGPDWPLVVNLPTSAFHLQKHCSVDSVWSNHLCCWSEIWTQYGEQVNILKQVDLPQTHDLKDSWTSQARRLVYCFRDAVTIPDNKPDAIQDANPQIWAEYCLSV